jgi:steroid 5-alpha reductase family enzyme
MVALTQVLIVNGAVIVGVTLILWVVATSRRDVSIVDLFWGCGFVVTVWLSAVQSSPWSARISLLAALTTLWGVRLSSHLARRNHGRPEDPRYAAMRAAHGPRFWWISLFTIFLLQGAILWFVSLPLQVTAVCDLPRAVSIADVLGTVLWSVGFLFESVGDWQLARFKADPANAGKVLDRGLWRYTRHPNYFGDCCVWWGLYLIAAAAGAAWTIASPVAMTLLLLKVSGVTLLERTITDRRPEYATYQARTNAFFPGPPRPHRMTRRDETT